MKLKICTKDDADYWDTLVSDAQYKTIFHTWNWLEALQSNGGGKLHAVIAEKEAKPVALMPLFVQKKAQVKLLFSPPPHMSTPYMGPLYIGDRKLSQIQRENLCLEFNKTFGQYIQSEIQPDYEFITTPPGLMDVRPWIWDGYSPNILYNYAFDLKAGLDTLWSNLKRQLRGEITRTKASGVTVRLGDEKDYMGLIQDTKKRYAEQGLKETTSKGFMMDVFKSYYPHSMDVLIVEQAGERLTGQIELHLTDTVTSWFGRVKSAAPGYPTTLLQWEAIRIAVESGAKTYVEVGANTRHLCHFKRQFNPEPIQYFNLRRYRNPMFWAAETGYTNVIKPMRALIQRGGGLNGG